MVDELIEIADNQRPNERTVFGTIDELVVNAGMAVAALIPTLFIGLVMPWKLMPLLGANNPKGRDGLLLGPGLFFIMAIIAAVFLAGIAFSPAPESGQIVVDDPSDGNKPIFGTRESIRVAQAMAEGDFSSALLTITPLFLLATFSGILSQAARPLLDDRWTLQSALKVWLYFLGISVSFTFIGFAMAAALQDNLGNTRLSSDIPMLVFLLYYFGSVFLLGFKANIVKAVASTIICGASFFFVIVAALSIVRI